MVINNQNINITTEESREEDSSVRSIKLKISSTTWSIPYDDELYFINLKEDIDNKLINISDKDVENFFNKWEVNWDNTNHYKSDKYCIFKIDNKKDLLIMEFILKEICYGIDRDWNDTVTNWRFNDDKEYREILKKGKKEYKNAMKKIKEVK